MIMIDNDDNDNNNNNNNNNSNKAVYDTLDCPKLRG